MALIMVGFLLVGGVSSGVDLMALEYLSGL